MPPDCTVPCRGWRAGVLAVVLALLAMLLPTAARAQGGVESALSPGPLIEGHAKYDADCGKCHVRFDRKAQEGLCLDCHKEVAADVRSKAGYHGRIRNRDACRSCHTDHKGRTARISSFEPRKFDHRQTDYLLRGAHEQVECARCHLPQRKYREAPQDCASCHGKDDVHKASLGPRCADCHTESDWKKARFDHSTSRFPLAGKHVDARCADCHKDNRYQETPRDCQACHRADDERKGHKGQFGPKCETCHNAKAWKPSDFSHDRDTRYALRGKHAGATCVACHKTPLYRARLSQDCMACHKADDKHQGTLGSDCAACHGERSWKEPPRFDHGATSFPLLGAHARVECKGCHRGPLFKEAARECIGCHRKDDKHAGSLGTACADCHAETTWKETRARFDHDRTRLRLRNAHAAAMCSACHRDAKDYRGVPVDCIGCHRKDDKHEGQLGLKCESCHGDKSWKVDRFDHSRARYPLVGRHLRVECKECHRSARYKDTPRECLACHRKDDRHDGRLGARCENCHNARDWPLWSYEHGKTAFALDGAHRKVRCEGCHRKPAPAGRDTAPLGVTCAACHGAEDVHGGQFGVRCEQCHVSESWKTLRGQAGFPDNRAPQGGRGKP
ncbi:cytochrome c3 family protein [Ramlibacter sp. AN1133]|uniref:cytochrome c3 family protein n=1 Tax=Ramlibacter sp. AN1133 TaxID=3133429 RepID=UPI0030C4D34E